MRLVLSRSHPARCFQRCQRSYPTGSQSGLDSAEQPKQPTFVCDVIDDPTAEAGWVTSIMTSLVQPPVATTCTVFVPALRPVNVVDPPSVKTVCVVAPMVTE